MGEVKLGCNNFCTPQRNPIQRSVYRNISLLKHTRHKCAQYMPIFQKVICKLCNQQNDSRRVRSVKFPTNRMVSMNLKVYRVGFFSRSLKVCSKNEDPQKVRSKIWLESKSNMHTPCKLTKMRKDAELERIAFVSSIMQHQSYRRNSKFHCHKLVIKMYLVYIKTLIKIQLFELKKTKKRIFWQTKSIKFDFNRIIAKCVLGLPN